MLPLFSWRKHLTILINPISWYKFCVILFYTFPLVLTALVTYFGLSLADRLEGPKEELLGELDINIIVSHLF